MSDTEPFKGYLTEERLMIQESAREFTRNEVAPAAFELDPVEGLIAVRRLRSAHLPATPPSRLRIMTKRWPIAARLDWKFSNPAPRSGNYGSAILMAMFSN